MKSKHFDKMLLGIGAVAQSVVDKALAPLRLQIAQLTAENAAMRDAIKDLRQKQAEAEMTPAALRDRYASLQ